MSITKPYWRAFVGFCLGLSYFTTVWETGWKAHLAQASAENAPTAVTTLSAKNLSGLQVNLSWNSVAGSLASYQVYRSTNGAPMVLIASVPVPATPPQSMAYGDTVPASDSYSYYISAKSVSGSESARGNVVTLPVGPQRVTTLAATLGVGQIELTWTVPSGNATYMQIWRTGPGSTSAQKIAKVPASSTKYSDANIVSSGSYSYYLITELEITGSTSIVSAKGIVAPALSITVPSVYSSCAARATATSDWKAGLASFVSAFSGTTGAATTICFAPGTYTGQMNISNANNIRLYAPEGNVHFTYSIVLPYNDCTSARSNPDTSVYSHCLASNTRNLPDNPGTIAILSSSGVVIENITVTYFFQVPPEDNIDVLYYVNNPTLAIRQSQGVTLRNVTATNTSRYPSKVYHPVSRVIEIRSSTGVQILSSSLQDPGKETLHLASSSDARVDGSQLKCYYFCLAVLLSHLSVTNADFTMNHEQIPNDKHPAMWVTSANVDISNSKFTFMSGLGIVGGSSVNEVSNQIIINGGSIKNPEKMWAWLPTHPNYKKLKLYVTGVFSPIIRPFYCIRGGGGNLPDIIVGCLTGNERGQPDPGTELNLRATASDAYRRVPLPPTEPEKLLFINADRVLEDGVFSMQQLPQQLPLGAASFTVTYSKKWSDVYPTTSYNGWLEPNGRSRTLSGDFLSHGKNQVMFFNTNSAGGGGAIRIQELDPGTQMFVNKYLKDWSYSLRATYAGLLDTNDRILAGDFLGDGKTQLLFFNTNPAQSGEVAILLQEYDPASGPSGDFVTRFQKSWSDIQGDTYTGWIDANDRIVAGDFLGDGKAQLLFFNVDPAQAGGGQILIQEFDSATSSFVTRFQQNWTNASGYAGRLDSNDRMIAGDFLGWGRHQLLFFHTNPNHLGTAIRIMELDLIVNAFVQRYAKAWSAIPANFYDKWLDSNDRIFSVGYVQ